MDKKQQHSLEELKYQIELTKPMNTLFEPGKDNAEAYIDMSMGKILRDIESIALNAYPDILDDFDSMNFGKVFLFNTDYNFTESFKKAWDEEYDKNNKILIVTGWLYQRPFDFYLIFTSDILKDGMKSLAFYILPTTYDYSLSYAEEPDCQLSKDILDYTYSFNLLTFYENKGVKLNG